MEKLSLLEMLIEVYKRSNPIDFSESDGRTGLEWAGRMLKQMNKNEQEQKAGKMTNEGYD